ncbi:MAG: transketolase [Acidimicrobiales bacterium]
MTSDIEQRAINVIRGLAMDAPFAAKSGHQGTAMALAPLAHVLWTRTMTYDAADPEWPDRDRFVLSNGHASILQYSMLHLTGFGLTLGDLRQFRQWGSLTPGHPESGHTTGIEVTTGPLGQGFANGVGLGLAERVLRAAFGSDVVDHYTYVFCGDGDLEEGISHEAASLAGHLGLGRLIYVYDDNHISIDGPTELALSDDPVGRFRAYGWDVDDIGESANDLDALEGALERAKTVTDRPSLVVLRSHIAFPSPKFTDDAAAHGNPFDADEIRRTKEVLGLPPDEDFYVPDDVLDYYRAAGARGADKHKAWQERFDAWDGDRAAWDAAMAGTGIAGWTDRLPTFEPGDELATRKASGKVLNALAGSLPGLVVGAADLTGNTGVKLDDGTMQDAGDPGGRQVHYGIREHAMGGIMNGLAKHGGILPVGGTFFVFSDYMRPAVRLACLSQAKVVYSWTHDSIGVGQDGPTHQPVEHLASLRAMPGLRLIRPADANETVAAWKLAIEHDGPTALVLSRQGLPVLEGTADGAVERGAYVLVGSDNDEPDLVLIGTGSEVSLCVDAATALADSGTNARVVSMPSWELFDEQSDAYQEQVLPADVPALAVEAGSTFGWDRWAVATIGLDRFGASAPGDVAMEHLGFTVENVVAKARELLSDLDAAE